MEKVKTKLIDEFFCFNFSSFIDVITFKISSVFIWLVGHYVIVFMPCSVYSLLPAVHKYGM